MQFSLRKRKRRRKTGEQQEEGEEENVKKLNRDRCTCCLKILESFVISSRSPSLSHKHAHAHISIDLKINVHRKNSFESTLCVCVCARRVMCTHSIADADCWLFHFYTLFGVLPCSRRRHRCHRCHHTAEEYSNKILEIEMNATEWLSEIYINRNWNIKWKCVQWISCTISAIQAIKIWSNVSAAQFSTDAICSLEYVRMVRIRSSLPSTYSSSVEWSAFINIELGIRFFLYSLPCILAINSVIEYISSAFRLAWMRDDRNKEQSERGETVRDR